MAVMLNRPQLGMVFLLAYTGLLRIREALSLRVKDVILHPKSVTLCLAVTKRGMEQKVVLTNPSVVVWATEFFNRFPKSKQQQQLFAISYNSALRWVKKLAMLLGAESLNLTTHTFRRSGASELARLGMPLADILLYGRWHSERAAREYIRRGEVAVLRSRGLISAQDWIRIDAWADLCPRVWKIYDGTFAKTSVPVRPNVVTPDKLNSIERLFFQRCCWPTGIVVEWEIQRCHWLLWHIARWVSGGWWCKGAILSSVIAHTYNFLCDKNLAQQSPRQGCHGEWRTSEI